MLALEGAGTSERRRAHGEAKETCRSAPTVVLSTRTGGRSSVFVRVLSPALRLLFSYVYHVFPQNVRRKSTCQLNSYT